LILRDGRATKEEKEQLPQVSKKYNFKFSLVNVIKHHNTRFKDNKYNFCVKSRDNVSYFVPHRRENARPVKLEKVTDSNGDHEIKEDEIYVTYALTRLDLARIYGEGNSLKLPTSLRSSHHLLYRVGNSLRLPAPIYYADRLVKMLDKGIYFYSDDEINQHFLFFI
jgi:argonaute-like protein implicated in RNA metabolism and viral defense